MQNIFIYSVVWFLCNMYGWLSKIQTYYYEQNNESFLISYSTQKSNFHFLAWPPMHTDCPVCLCLSSKGKGSKVIWLTAVRALEENFNVWPIEKSLLLRTLHLHCDAPSSENSLWSCSFISCMDYLGQMMWTV